MSGKAITVAARIQPSQVCTTWMSSCWSRKIPIGRRREKIKSRMKPATVGGSTIGSVRIPSTTALTLYDSFTTFRAA